MVREEYFNKEHLKEDIIIADILIIGVFIYLVDLAIRALNLSIEALKLYI